MFFKQPNILTCIRIHTKQVFHKMTCVGFFIFFLSSIFFPCEGKNIPLPGETEITILPGSSENLTWSYDDSLNVASRSWLFTSSGGIKTLLLAQITKSFGFQVAKDALPGFTIIQPATLSLKNVSHIHDGTYHFALKIAGRPEVTSEVIVFIAIAPSVTLSCSSLLTVDEGDNVTCVCKGQGGNPPANVTWYKDGKKIGGTEKEEKTLSLNNVDRKASGTYKCVAQSHTLKDEKVIEIIVYFAFPPTVISFASTPENIVFGKSIVITCEAIAVPIPSYIIVHNNSVIVSVHKTYIITDLTYSHAGSYQCIAANRVGNSSKILNLSVTAKPTTNASNTNNFEREKTVSEKCSCGGTEWYVIVGSNMSGILIGLLLAYILLCSRRRWFRNRKSEQQVEARTTEVDSTYQELDLTKMNKEDDYESLRMSAANNVAEKKDDSTYTELNKTRDVENNYQSLT